MAVSLFIFAIMLSLSKAQESFESDNGINGYNNYSNNSNCIGKYRDLEEYVLNNRDLMDSLTEVFFKTGKTHAEFVKITYKFKVLLPPTNSTNDTTISLSYGNDDSEFTCVDDQKKFIWSSLALYLLGPKPLFWFTLFAVNVHESSVTVQLPCLCSDAYDNLLPRLTYLIKVYPAMQFQSQTVQFISTYFFETKAPDEDNYKAIVSILSASAILPSAAFFVFSYLMYFYSEWIVRLVENYIKDGEEKIKRKRLRDKDTSHQESADDIQKEKHKRRVEIAALILVCICLTIALFVFHVIASVKLIQYGNEVLNDVKVRNDINFENEQQDGDDQAIPIIYTVFSFLPILILIIFIIIMIIYYCGSDSQSDDEDLGKYLQLSLGVLLVYLGFCFSTYMVLAFINDPIVTGFVYLIGASCIFCIYLVSYTLCLTSSHYWVYAEAMDKLSGSDKLRVSFTLLSGMSLAYFLTILIVILTLGNFQDFQAVQNLTLPIIIGLLSIFVFKPLFGIIKNRVKIDTTDHDADHDNVTIQNPVNNADQDHTNGTADEDI